MTEKTHVHLRVVGEPKMQCSDCERTVEFVVSELAGVRSVTADHETQRIEIAADSTVAQRVTALTQFFSWAKGEGLVDDNPADDVSVSAPKKFRPRSLEPTDLRKLLRAAHAGGMRRDAAIIETLAGTGLRVNELLRLEFGDLEIRPRSGKLVVREGKHGGSRTVPLVVEVRKALTPTSRRSIRWPLSASQIRWTSII